MRLSYYDLKELVERINSYKGFENIILSHRYGYYAIEKKSDKGGVFTIATGLKCSEAYYMLKGMLETIKILKGVEKC